MPIPFYIVDVFAEERFAGNQLAVFRGHPSPDIMHKIAVEMNYSETTFITSDTPRSGGYDVRIFMPAKEVPFAGHPTLGTAYIIRQELIGQAAPQVVLNLGVGQIPVTFADDEVLWMQQKPPQFGHVYTAAQMADALRLPESDLDSRFPVQEVSTGLPFIMVPLKSLQAVKRARIDPDKLRALIGGVGGLGADAVLLFCPEVEGDGHHLHVRVPEDALGMREDPATGSANGCLAGYLVQHRYFGGAAIDIRVEQGYEIGRPSLLLLRASQKEGYIEVNVGGKVILVAKGEMMV